MEWSRTKFVRRGRTDLPGPSAPGAQTEEPASGPLVTAGGLLFRRSPAGQVAAHDVRTGVRRRAPRTSEDGAPGCVRGRRRPTRPTASSTILIPMPPRLCAFTLDATVPARGEPSPDPSVDGPPGGPAPRETDEIETATLTENMRGSVGGRCIALDEHSIYPVRARFARGTRIRLTNNTEIGHTVTARDATRNSGSLAPGMGSFVTVGERRTFPLPTARSIPRGRRRDHSRSVTPSGRVPAPGPRVRPAFRLGVSAAASPDATSPRRRREPVGRQVGDHLAELHRRDQARGTGGAPVRPAVPRALTSVPHRPVEPDPHKR